MLFFQLPRFPERFPQHGAGRSRGPGSWSPGRRTHLSWLRPRRRRWQEPGALTAALNWYRAMLLSNPRKTGRKVTVPTMYVWSDGDQRCSRRVLGCAATTWSANTGSSLKGVALDLDEQPDTVADLLLDWFGTHPGA